MQSGFIRLNDEGTHHPRRNWFWHRDAGYEVTGLTGEQVAQVPQRLHLSAIQLDLTSAALVAAVVEPFDELPAALRFYWNPGYNPRMSGLYAV